MIKCGLVQNSQVCLARELGKYEHEVTGFVQRLWLGTLADKLAPPKREHCFDMHLGTHQLESSIG